MPCLYSWREQLPRLCATSSSLPRRGTSEQHRSSILAENDTPPASPELSAAIIDRAFGAENRARIIDTYFGGRGTPTAADAWQNVYRLLLWIDGTTGLAHCYESDKSQPGRNWYARSLAFHGWTSSELGVTALKLGDEIDYLFRRATEDLATVALHRRDALMRIAASQRGPYAGRQFPEPGEDPELLRLLSQALEPYLAQQPPPGVWRALIQRLRQYMAHENKRKNLVGEGFEDVLASVIGRVSQHHATAVFVRRWLDEVPGFHPMPRGGKRKKVDLALVQRDQRRTLITAKWSVRADREEQFKTDYDDYIRAEAFNSQFDYVFVTNEFDPARLKRACERLERNAPMFTHVVHINTDGLLAAYGAAPERSAASVVEHIERGRLISLSQWLALLD
jgi:hypothetical protein